MIFNLIAPRNLFLVFIAVFIWRKKMIKKKQGQNILMIFSFYFFSFKFILASKYAELKTYAIYLDFVAQLYDIL